MSFTGPPTLANLQAQIDQLQAQIAALQPSEALQPTYLTTSPDGTVSADFSGKISAKGVSLKSADAISDGASVTWEETDSTNVIGWIWGEYAAGFGAFSSIQISAQPPGAIDATLGSTLSIESTATGGHMTVVVPDGSGGTQSAVVIDDQGYSDFAQLLTKAQAKIAYGTAVIQWTSTSPLSYPTVVDTGFTNLFAAVGFAAGETSGTSKACIVFPGAADSPNLRLYARVQDNSNANSGEILEVYWIALGN